MNATTSEPRAWVGCLACYNDGRLVGDWVQGVDAAAFVPCGRAGHEEWWVFDHEGYGDTLGGECDPMEAQRVAELLATLEDGERAPFSAWCRYEDGDGDLDRFRDQYRGEWSSLAEYAEELARDTAASPEVVEAFDSWPGSCIDWEHAGRELELGGDMSTQDAPGCAVWVFEPNA